MTALDVAKPEYLYAFGNGDQRPSSVLSNHTIRPVESFASLASVFFESPTDSSSICSTDHIDIDTTIHQLLSSLRVTSPSTTHRNHSSEHLNYLKTNLEKTTRQCDQIIQHFRDRINEATKVVNDLQKNADRIDAMRDVVMVATQGKLILRSISPKKRHRDSEDSQLTIVSRSQTWASEHTPCHTSTATQTTMIDHFFAHSIPSYPPTWLDRLAQCPDSSVCKASSPSKIALKFKGLTKKKRRLEEKICNLQLAAELGQKQRSSSSFSSNTCRVKAWLKRMVAPVHSPRKLEIVFDIDEKNCIVGREVKDLQGSPTTCGDAIDASIDNALRTSQVVLEAVKRDLESIKRSLVAVNFLLFFLVGVQVIYFLFISFRQNNLSTWRIIQYRGCTVLSKEQSKLVSYHYRLSKGDDLSILA